jgi:peptidoglycan/LPS O-acetylase OafA/YrhL
MAMPPFGMGGSAQTGLMEEQQVPKRSLFAYFTFQSKLARSSQYRPDVDGLRALAVLPVVLFHTDIPGFSGGFVGVDIFYVISGYLITSIVAKDLSRGRFSLISFYDRRIRRIFPALFAMLFVCFLAGYLLLAPADFTTFGKSLVAITFFMSNIFFKRKGGTEGYFANASHTQVLLHTWSLSVEEQFYLFFPTTLLLITRYLKDFTKHILWLGICVSFAINIWATQHAPQAAFYIFIPRAWELLLGALLAVKAVPLLKQRVSREIAGLAGLGLIAWAVVGLTKYTAFPGFAALLPCLGAWLVIYAGESGPSLTKSILSWRPLVFIGVISYSLYLWHWPIIVFTKYVVARPLISGLSHGEAIAVIPSSILIAFLSYEFVESPFRGGDSRISRRQIFAFGFATSALSAVLGFSLYLTQGFPGRFDSGTLQLITKNLDRKNDYENRYGNWKTQVRSEADIQFAYLGDPSSKKIMFLGDSHALQLYPLIRDIYYDGALHGRGVIFAVAAGCLPAEHLNRIDPGFHCDSFTHFALRRAMRDDIDTVFIGFLASNSSRLCPSVDGRCVSKLSGEDASRRFFEELANQVQMLETHGKRVIVSLPFPLFDKSIPDLEARKAQLQKFGWSLLATETSSQEARTELMSIGQALGVQIFDPRKSLCSNQTCITQIGGVSIYMDQAHIAASQIGILKDEMVRTLQSDTPSVAP